MAIPPGDGAQAVVARGKGVARIAGAAVGCLCGNAAAGKLLQVGESAVDDKMEQAELAAWTVVANAIFNLDETIMKE